MNNTNKEIPTAEQVLEYRNKFANCEIMSESEIIEAQKMARVDTLILKANSLQTLKRSTSIVLIGSTGHMKTVFK